MLHIFDSIDSLLPALADFVVAQAKNSIQREGRFSFVLSGGSSPKRLYELLASGKYRKQIEWEKVFFFFGDERFVPATHPDSNYLMAKKTLFDPLNISQSQIYPVNTRVPPAESAHSYQNNLLTYFNGNPERFDLILLGLGENAHTASLFPHNSLLNEKKALVKEAFIEEVKMYRITFTAPLINQAGVVAFLVYGPSKAEAVQHILEGKTAIEEFPAQLIRPQTGEVHWFLDKDAAGNLEGNPD